MAVLSPAAFEEKYITRFADNTFQNIVEGDFRELVTDLKDSFAAFAALNVKIVKGATYPVPFLDSLGLIPPAYRILGMQAVARVGLSTADAATAGPASFGQYPPVSFQLVRDSAGDVDAFTDVEPETTTTVKARWVRVSGPETERLDSFPDFVPEDRTPGYKAGDVFVYEFPGGQRRLFEVRADIDLYTNPVPTGEDDDPYYAPFATLATLEHAPNTDIGTLHRTFTLNLNSQVQDQGEVRTVLVFEGLVGGTKAAISFKAQNANNTETPLLQQCLNYTGDPADVWTALGDAAAVAANTAAIAANTAAITGLANSKQNADTYGTLNYAATLSLDFNSANTVLQVDMTGALTFGSTSNRAAGKKLRVRLKNTSATAQTLTLNSSWVVYGTAPTSIAAGKWVTLALECCGTSETSVEAGAAMQA